MKKYSIALILFVSTILFPAFTPVQDSIVVIVNNENPIATLTASEAKLFYLRKLKSRWPGINKNIRPVDRKTKCAERSTFYESILKMDDKSVESYFAERQFQNAERAPEKMNSDSEVVDYVASEIGAIGYIKASSLTGDVKSKVKVVLTL
jgi:ABC-type phosphate transport system substrate-binding protein